MNVPVNFGWPPNTVNKEVKNQTRKSDTKLIDKLIYLQVSTQSGVIFKVIIIWNDSSGSKMAWFENGRASDYWYDKSEKNPSNLQFQMLFQIYLGLQILTQASGEKIDYDIFYEMWVWKWREVLLY